jgi:hypothetical protein
MIAGDAKLRIAVAVVEPGGDIASMVEALLAGGVPAGRIGLIGQATTATSLVSPVTDGTAGRGGTGNVSLIAILNDLGPFGALRNSQPLEASQRLLRLWRSGWRMPALWSSERDPDDGPSLAADLERQVRKGAVLLTVMSTSPGEQLLCTRLLLKISSSPVLAIEGSLPAADRGKDS